MSNFKKENTVKNIKNFTPYGTDPEKDKMVKSSDYGDRLKMAKVGYGLDVLINDKDDDVRKAVLNYLKDNNLTLTEWCNQNNKEIDLKNLAYSPYPEARVAAIKSGYVYKESEMYIAPDCKFTPYGTDSEKDKMVNSDYLKNRFKMAKEGYGLDVLINDEAWGVRAKVAKQGYGLDVLINDEDYDVREAALDYLKENNLTLAEWCNQNNKEIDLRKLAFSSYLEVRVEAVRSGYIYKKDEIYIDSNCKFIPYGTDPKKDKMVNSDYWRDRLEMAEEGYGLDILINDEDWKVRRTVVEQGYGLGILVNDEDYDVRAAVVEQGYGLDVLINDEVYDVRAAVAEQGYGLDILINDKHWIVQEAVKNYLTSHNLTLEQWKSNQEHSKTNIINTKNFIPYGTDSEKDKMVKSDNWRDRLEMAKQGYGLEVLINDEDYDVRATVAEQGYGLDILINDKDWEVREAVLYYLKDNNLTLAEWCNQNNKEIDLKKIAFSPYPETRIAAIESGYVYKENEIYIAPNCKFTPYGIDSKKDKMVKSYYPKDRLEMAKEGYGLDVLINDKSWLVRQAVARQGYGLDVLINDDWSVREAVAKQGYGLNILINDENCDVRTAALDYLKENNLSLPEWSKQNPQKTDFLDTSKIIEKANNSIRELENMISQIQVDLAKTKKSLEKIQDFSNIEKEK